MTASISTTVNVNVSTLHAIADRSLAATLSALRSCPMDQALSDMIADLTACRSLLLEWITTRQDTTEPIVRADEVAVAANANVKQRPAFKVGQVVKCVYMDMTHNAHLLGTTGKVTKVKDGQEGGSPEYMVDGKTWFYETELVLVDEQPATPNGHNAGIAEWRTLIGQCKDRGLSVFVDGTQKVAKTAVLRERLAEDDARRVQLSAEVIKAREEAKAAQALTPLAPVHTPAKPPVPAQKAEADLKDMSPELFNAVSAVRTALAQPSPLTIEVACRAAKVQADCRTPQNMAMAVRTLKEWLARKVPSTEPTTPVKAEPKPVGSAVTVDPTLPPTVAAPKAPVVQPKSVPAAVQTKTAVQGKPIPNDARLAIFGINVIVDLCLSWGIAVPATHEQRLIAKPALISRLRDKRDGK